MPPKKVDDAPSATVSSKSSDTRLPIFNPVSTTKIFTAEERVTYTWKDINVFSYVKFSLKNKILNCCKNRQSVVRKKQILFNVCGIAYPGEVLAILGSSGAGKSSLLNAITFNSPSTVTTSGTRCINGVPVSPKVFASQSAYVQQEDLFMGALTVKEHLIFQALVRMDRNISYDERMQRVEDVMVELALVKCQYTQIGMVGRIKGISGGEKKRLAFAGEVLTNPKLMFCDEPTSGLDSYMALSLVNFMKRMAKTGKTVVCTIHQPSSEVFAKFDKILLMAEGRPAFLGTPDEGLSFFKELDKPCPANYNPADFFVQVLAIVPEREESCRQTVRMISDKFEKSTMGVNIALKAGRIDKPKAHHGEFFRTRYKASCFAQFRAVLWRSWLCVIKEPLLIRVRLLQTVVIAFIIGSVYYGQKLNREGVMNINGALFILMTAMSIQNVFGVVHVFCDEMEVFLREHRNGMYRADVYFMSNILAEAPIFVLLPIILTGVSYFMIGLNSDWYRFLIACGIMIIVGLVATSFGYMISCTAPDVGMALSLAPAVIIPLLLLGGFFLNIDSIPVYFVWLSYISWFRFGTEALMINQWDNITNIDCLAIDLMCPKDGHTVLEMFDFDADHFNMDLIIMVILLFSFRIVAFAGLLLKTYGLA